MRQEGKKEWNSEHIKRNFFHQIIHLFKKTEFSCMANICTIIIRLSKYLKKKLNEEYYNIHSLVCFDRMCTITPKVCYFFLPFYKQITRKFTTSRKICYTTLHRFPFRWYVYLYATEVVLLLYGFFSLRFMLLVYYQGCFRITLLICRFMDTIFFITILFILSV